MYFYWFLTAILLVAGQPIKKEDPETEVVNQKEILFRENVTESTLLDCVGQSAIKSRVKSYKWMKDGVFLSTANTEHHTYEMKSNGSLIILKPSEKTEGTYQCLTETQDGIASSQKYVVKKTYIILPAMKTSELTPVKGLPFNLECPIPKGYPKPNVIWVKKSKPEVPILDKRITLSPDGNLWFSNATNEDVSKDDMFICMVSSPALEKPAEIASIRLSSLLENNELNKGELVAQYLSGDIVALAGETTAIFCIYGGTPLAHPDWFKDGTNVNGQPGDRVTRHNRSAGKRLLIKDTRPEDAGVYTCVVDNEVGAKKSHTINMKVEEKPALVDKAAEKDIRAKLGKDISISCPVRGIPELEVIWTYNAQSLASTDRIVINHEGMMIKNAKLSDRGYYGCQAVNKHGDLYTEFSVTFE